MFPLARCLMSRLCTSLLVLSTSAAFGAGIHWEPMGEPDCGGWITSMRYSPYDEKRILVCGDMLGIGLSEDGGASWQGTFGLRSWEIGDVTWDPRERQVVWAGTVSGPYMSVDGGRNWQERRNGMPPPAGFGNSAPIEKVLIDPQDSAHVLAFGGSSRRWDDHGKGAMGIVWESRDRGAHWLRLAALAAEGSNNAPDGKGINIVSAAYAHGNFRHLYVALDHHGILASVDGGKIWAPKNDGIGTMNPERIVAHPTDPETVFCSLDNERDGANFKPGGIFKSVDGGSHWVSISNGLEQNVNSGENFTARYKAFAVCESDPAVMYAANHAWFKGGVFVTKDGGSHWSRCVDTVEKFYPAAIPGTVFECDPRNPNIAWCLGAEHMILTRDGGATWRDGGNYLPQETKAAWRGRGYSGMCATSIRFNPAVPGEAVAQALDSGRAWLSRDGLRTWTRYLDKPDPWGGGNDASFAGPKVIYASTSRGGFTGIGRSRDAGATWEVLAGNEHGLPELHAPGEALGIYASGEAPDRAWACIGGSLYATEDGGGKWSVIHRGPGLKWIAADPRHPKRLYISGEKDIYATEDGTHFRPIGGPHSGGRLAVDMQGRVLVTASNGSRNGVWRFDGKGWERLLDESFAEAVAVDPTAPERLLLGTNQNPYLDISGATGVWISADGGKSWSRQNDGLAMLRGYVAAFDPHNPERVVFGTQGRGFFVGAWPRAFHPAGGRAYVSSPEDSAFAKIDPTPEPP